MATSKRTPSKTSRKRTSKPQGLLARLAAPARGSKLIGAPKFSKAALVVGVLIIAGISSVLIYSSMAATKTVNGLTGKYYNASKSITTPAKTRTDAEVNFNWGTGNPAPGVNADDFIVKWSGKLQIPAKGSYKFYTSTEGDDGVRVYVETSKGTVKVIDTWTKTAKEKTSKTINFSAKGKVTLRVEYYEHKGSAKVALQWSGPNFSKRVIASKYLFTPFVTAKTPNPTPGSIEVVRPNDSAGLPESNNAAQSDDQTGDADDSTNNGSDTQTGSTSVKPDDQTMWEWISQFFSGGPRDVTGL